MNSQTWLVEDLGRTYVAKSVAPEALPDLTAGCEVAERLAQHGLVTGRPVPTTDGALVLAAAGLALLEHVPGRELDGESEEEQHRMARMLARVHEVTQAATATGLASFLASWLSPTAPGVSDHPWLSRAIEEVRRETAHLSLTWAVLHTDPAPKAFLHDDASGVTGLVDWAGAGPGPVLYDVASAVMYLGGPEHARAFLQEYEAAGILTPEELRHLATFRRLREVVQGVYFAGRTARDDRTGGVDPAENDKGLADARRRLAALDRGRG